MRRSIIALALCSLMIGLAAFTVAAAEAKDDSEPALISIEVREASVPEVVQRVMKDAGENVVLDGDVTGTISLSKHNVPVERVLEDVYQAKGYYWWRDREGTYFISTQPRPEPTAEASAPAKPKVSKAASTMHTVRFFDPQYLCYLFGTSDEPGSMPYANPEYFAAGGPPLSLSRTTGAGVSGLAELSGMGGGRGGMGGMGGGGMGGGRGGMGGMGGGGMGGMGGGRGGMGGMGGGMGGMGGGRGGMGGMGGGMGGRGGGIGAGGGAGYLSSFVPEGITEMVAVPILNGIIVRGSEESVSQLIDFIRMIDKKPQQIIVELQSVLVSTELEKQFGINWFYAIGNTTIEPIGFTTPGASVRIGYTGHENFQAALSYLLRTGHGRVTDAIRISTMNLLPAFNSVVVAYPVIQVGGVAGGGLGGGGVQTVSLTYVPIQTYLQILPQILGDGTINMVIPYQKATQTGSVPVPLAAYGSYDAPIWTYNTLLTTVNVRDGETFVVGGFVGGINQASELRFPLLGDIPLIGDLLFTRRTRTVTESETLLFITPRIVKEEAVPVTLGPI